MKKTDIVKKLLIGGCIGITLMRVSYMVVNILMGKITEEMLDAIKLFFLVFAWGGICFTIASYSISKLEHKDLKSIERQKLLKKQIKAVSVIIAFFTVFLIVYIIKRITLGIILSLSFIIVFVLWGYGYLLAYLNLKNNMVMIRK